MSLVDAILNLAALFLWIDWRTGRAASAPQPVISLASALRETNRRRSGGWSSLAAAAGLLMIRPLFYYTIGSAAEWTPVMDLLALSLPFRSDMLDRMFAYSTISFGLTLGFYYGCLLLIGAVRSAAPEAEVVRRFIRAQLGWLAKLPWYLKLLMPFAAVALAWAALVPLLEVLEITPGTAKTGTVWRQAGILALSAILAWKWFFVVLFLAYALNSYVYLGTHPIWAYLADVCGWMLKPFWFMRIGKLDFAPFIAIGLLLALSEFAVRPLVLRLFEETVA